MDEKRVHLGDGSRIAFAKIGKSLKFVSKYSPIGGDNEGPQLLRLLANNNPNMTFIIVGRSDFYKVSSAERAKLFPYDNVIDAWENARGAADQNHLVNYFKQHGQPDAFVAMPGQIGTVTIQGMIEQVKDRSLIASVIDMTKNYTSPITFWWNQNPQIKVIEIINDPRYDLAQSRDIINDPDVSLSQYTYSYKKDTIISYKDQTRVPRMINPKYAGMERIFLYDRPEPVVSVKDRNTNFMVVLNQGNPSRYPFLKEWVLDQIDDVEVYGQWDDVYMKDSRFKGSMQLEDLQKKLQNVRATFIIPIAKGWCTSKYVEMIYAGVIPFFHPTYDEQLNLGPLEFLRVKSPEQLMKRLELIADDKIYTDIITHLQSQFCAHIYLQGKEINQHIMTAIDPSYQQANLETYQKTEVVSLDSFF